MRGSWSVLLLYSCVCATATGFVVEETAICSFGNEKSGNVTFYYQVNFNRQPILGFSKQDKMFLPSPYCFPQLRMVADDICMELNQNPNMLEYMQDKETSCKQQVVEYWGSTVQRTVEPSMKVYLAEAFHAGAPRSLVCYVWGFYPSLITVSWVKNEDTVISNTTEADPLGDWTYQVVAVLNLRDADPEDTYMCVVDHVSLDNVKTAKWKQGLTSIQILKISISSVILAVGLIFAITGLVCWSNSSRVGCVQDFFSYTLASTGYICCFHMVLVYGARTRGPKPPGECGHPAPGPVSPRPSPELGCSGSHNMQDPICDSSPACAL
ncbi:HLA class II histocompatibility antigen, DM beta chain [Pelodytes ibericus]